MLSRKVLRRVAIALFIITFCQSMIFIYLPSPICNDDILSGFPAVIFSTCKLDNGSKLAIVASALWFLTAIFATYLDKADLIEKRLRMISMQVVNNVWIRIMNRKLTKKCIWYDTLVPRIMAVLLYKDDYITIKSVWDALIYSNKAMGTNYRVVVCATKAYHYSHSNLRLLDLCSTCDRSVSSNLNFFWFLFFLNTIIIP